MKPYIPALAAAALLAACGSAPPTMLTSLEGLTSETQRQGLSDVNQNRILSMTGLLPHSQVGSLYRYKHKRSPSTAIGISNGGTFYVESQIPAPPDIEDAVAKVKSKILEVRLAGRIALGALLAESEAKAALAIGEQSDPKPDNIAALRKAATDRATEYRKSKKAFDCKLNKASASIETSGLIVVRWDARENKSTSSVFGKLFGRTTGSSEQSSGFAIIAGLRLMTLFVGADIWDAQVPMTASWRLADAHFPWIVYGHRFPWIGRWRVRDLRLTTHLLQGQHIEYLQDVDLSREVKLALKGSYKELSRIGTSLKALDNIEVDYLRKQLSSLSNMGSIAGTQRNVFPLPFDTRKRMMLMDEIVIARDRSDSGMDTGDPAGEPGGQHATESHGELYDFYRAVNLQLTGRDLDQPRQKRERAGELEVIHPDEVEGVYDFLTARTQGWQTIYAVDSDFIGLRDAFKQLD